MPYPYQVWLRQPCLDYLATLRKFARSRILLWIEELAVDFNREGDFSLGGSDDRDWKVAVVGSHAVVWWVDHPACEVKIVAIRPADR